MGLAYFSPSTLAFIPAEWKDDGTYSDESWPQDAILLTQEESDEFRKQSTPEGKHLGVVNGRPAWVSNPLPSNSDLLKAALQGLSVRYQSDIETLNRAWLAAAVNDGVNESTKKDAVISQINARKSQYASDRSAVIAQYPI